MAGPDFPRPHHKTQVDNTLEEVLLDEAEKMKSEMQGHTRVIESEMEKMSGVAQAFRPKVRFRGSEWARWLRLVAFMFGIDLKSNGRRQTLGNHLCRRDEGGERSSERGEEEDQEGKRHGAREFEANGNQNPKRRSQRQIADVKRSVEGSLHDRSVEGWMAHLRPGV